LKKNGSSLDSVSAEKINTIITISKRCFLGGEGAFNYRGFVLSVGRLGN
jgi:hypothetical protein